MSMTTYANDILTKPTRIRALDCSECGVTFGINADFEQRRRQDKRNFYCPNGHTQYFPGKTDAQRAQDRAAYLEGRLTHVRDQLESTERSRAAFKGQVTRMRRRVGKGVCPCCNRTFQDLARHMENKHPDFAESETHQ